MKIDQVSLNTMFTNAGISKEKLYAALIEMGPKELKAPLRKDWSVENPTRNFCYVVSEFVLNFVAPLGSKAYSLVVDGDTAKHYFVKTEDGKILDLTAEQFDDYSKIDYNKAKKTHFMHPSPSRRTIVLAKLMGYLNENGAPVDP